MIDSSLVLITALCVGLFVVSLLNCVMFLVLVKNLHWLWVKSKEDSKDLGDYIAQKIREGV